MEIDAAHELVYRPGRAEPISELKGRRRLIELLLLLAFHGRRAPGIGITEGDIARAAAGHLAPKLARRYLRELHEVGLVAQVGDRQWTLALVAQEQVVVVPVDINNALALVQRAIAGNPRRKPAPTPQERREASLARAELALVRGDPSEALATLSELGGKEVTFIQNLLRKLPKKVREEFMTRAVGTRGIACMNRGETKAALYFLRHAQARACKWRGGEEWLIRLTATEAAVHRMNAALDGAGADRHVKACLATFERAQNLADSSTTLPATSRSHLRRWLYAEGTTALAMQAAREFELGGPATTTIEKAKRWLGTAFDELGRLPVDPAAEASTYLMQMRFPILQGHLGRDRSYAMAESDARSASLAASHKLAPEWIRGWVPRYDADLAYVATRSGQNARVRSSLVQSWTMNRGFGFQQLLVLARFVAWSIDPKDLLDATQLRNVLRAWHLTLLGKRMEDCPTCALTHDSLRRIRCVLKFDPRTSRDPIALGVWR